MDAVPFFIFLAMPFPFLILALRDYAEAYHNVKIFFYVVTTVAFMMAAMMFIMHSEEGILFVVEEGLVPPATRINIDCIGLNQTGLYQDYPVFVHPNIGDPGRQVFYHTYCGGGQMEQSNSFVHYGPAFGSQQISVNIPGMGFPSDLFGDDLAYYDQFYYDEYYFVRPDKSYEIMYPLTFFYGGLGAVMMVFSLSEMLRAATRVG